MNATPSKTPAQRGWRTLGQNTVAAIIGFPLAIWGVPGVPDAIQRYAQDNFLPLVIALLVLVGIPGAVVAYVQNRLEAHR